MEQRTSSTRSLTAARVAVILSACIIPVEGPNKLPIVGRGNPHTREDGTAVRIFNVQAFASAEDAQKAAEFFQQGQAIEKSGDIEGAQQAFKDALNMMMSFSVLEQNAADFASAYQILGKIEQVPTRDGGTKLGINNPRPVAVATTGASTAHLFKLDKEELKKSEDIATNSAETKKLQATKPSLSDLSKAAADSGSTPK